MLVRVDTDSAAERTLPMFPLGSVVFPTDPLPLHVFEPRYRKLVEDCVYADLPFGVVLIERGHEVGGGDVRGDAGVSVRIDRALPVPDGRYVLECTGVERIRVLEWLTDDPYPRARVEPWPDAALDPAETDLSTVRRRSERLFEILTEIAESRDLPSPEVPSIEGPPVDAGTLWTFASALPLGSADRAKILVADTVAERVRIIEDALDDVIAVAEFSRMPPG